MKYKISSGDDVPSHIIKITGPAIVKPPTYNVNLSVRTGKFAHRLTPLSKKGDSTKFENCRPIRGFFKIFENDCVIE